MSSSGAVTDGFADAWRAQSSQVVEDQSDNLEVIAVVPVRVESDNATVQVASTNSSSEESVTFFEFVLDDSEWKLLEVIS